MGRCFARMTPALIKGLQDNVPPCPGSESVSTAGEDLQRLPQDVYLAAWREVPRLGELAPCSLILFKPNS